MSKLKYIGNVLFDILYVALFMVPLGIWYRTLSMLCWLMDNWVMVVVVSIVLLSLLSWHL